MKKTLRAGVAAGALVIGLSTVITAPAQAAQTGVSAAPSDVAKANAQTERATLLDPDHITPSNFNPKLKVLSMEEIEQILPSKIDPRLLGKGKYTADAYGAVADGELHKTTALWNAKRRSKADVKWASITSLYPVKGQSNRDRFESYVKVPGATVKYSKGIVSYQLPWRAGLYLAQKFSGGLIYEVAAKDAKTARKVLKKIT